MTEQERFNENVIRRLDVQDERFTSVTNNINSLTNELREFKQEMRDFKNETRQQNEMRTAESRELREEVRTMGRHFQNATWAMIAGVVAIAVGVWTK